MVADCGVTRALIHIIYHGETCFRLIVDLQFDVTEIPFASRWEIGGLGRAACDG